MDASNIDITKSSGFWAVIPGTVLRDSSLSSTAVLVYADISIFLDSTGACRMTNDQIGKVRDLSAVQVSRCISQLRSAGHIDVHQVQRADGTNERIITLTGLSKMINPIIKNDKPPLSKMISSLYIESNNIESIYKEKEKKEKEKLSPRQILMDFAASHHVVSQMDAYWNMRRENNIPVDTPLKAKRLINALVAAGKKCDATYGDIITQATDHLWRSFYAVDAQRNPAAAREDRRQPELEEW